MSERSLQINEITELEVVFGGKKLGESVIVNWQEKNCAIRLFKGAYIYLLPDCVRETGIKVRDLIFKCSKLRFCDNIFS